MLSKKSIDLFLFFLPLKQFAVVIGDSHLRSIVDGFVDLPKSDVSFGFMSYPGAKAADLELEVKHAVLPFVPDMVCIMASSNDISGHSVSQAGDDFRRLLQTAMLRWKHVSCFLQYFFLSCLFACLSKFEKK